ALIWGLLTLVYTVQAQDKFIIQSALNNDLVLSIADNSSKIKKNVQLGKYAKKDTQKWKMVPSNEKGYFYLRSAAGKNVMDIQYGNRNSRANVWMYASNRSHGQKWKRIATGDGFFYIQSKLGHYLDVKGGVGRDKTPIWTYTLNRSKAQKWRFTPADRKFKVPNSSACPLTKGTPVYTERGKVTIQKLSTRYAILPSGTELRTTNAKYFTAPTLAYAEEIKKIVEFYKIGRSYPIVSYNGPDGPSPPPYIFFGKDGQPLRHKMSRERGTTFDAANLTVKKFGDKKWTVMDGSTKVHAFGTREKAVKAICLIRKYKFSKLISIYSSRYHAFEYFRQ
ncbi:MAG: RICIN domain-containing protein, partial [Bacteroidota bacterium]